MTIRHDPTPPVDCDVCGAEIVGSIDGFLACEVVDLHDGTPPKDVCLACLGKPLIVIFPHILERKSGNRLRPAPAAAGPQRFLNVLEGHIVDCPECRDPGTDFCDEYKAIVAKLRSEVVGSELVEAADVGEMPPAEKTPAPVEG